MTLEPERVDRDYVYALQVDFHIDAQLWAIRGLLHRNRQAARELEREMEDLDRHARQQSGLLRERAIEEWGERLHDSVYQDAAHSMAAVGMLAPFVETLFVQCFHGIRRLLFADADPQPHHTRWAAGGKHRWECSWWWDGTRWRKELVRGVLQLAEAIGLSSELPASLETTLCALFSYRNKMFHCGFEWPMPERVDFGKRIEQKRWPQAWFLQSTIGDEPWIFYLSPDFVDHCLDVVEEILDGIGAFVRKRCTMEGRA